MKLYACIRAGRCYWEKTSSGCEDIDERLHFDAYDFYSICRTGGQCETTAKIVGGRCRDPGAKPGAATGFGLDLDRLSNADYCTECEQGTCVSRNLHCLQTFCVRCACHLYVLAEGYVLLTENAECSGKDVELAPQCVLGSGRW